MKTNINTWIKDTEGVSDILGFMYTQWGTGYGNMKQYFDLLNTYDQWSKGRQLTPSHLAKEPPA